MRSTWAVRTEGPIPVKIQFGSLHPGQFLHLTFFVATLFSNIFFCSSGLILLKVSISIKSFFCSSVCSFTLFYPLFSSVFFYILCSFWNFLIFFSYWFFIFLLSFLLCCIGYLLCWKFFFIISIEKLNNNEYFYFNFFYF